MADAGTAAVSIEVLAGHDPAQLITAAAERFGDNVICVGSRGRGALTKAMLGGSVSQAILLATARPVLMVPAPVRA